MPDKPIIFSAPMVRAILDGRKTMTRRVLKPQPIPVLSWSDPPENTYPVPTGWKRLPYAPGDVLWVREGWTPESVDAEEGYYRPDYRATANGQPTEGRWRSPIHMPRGASRITLRVTAVKVERLQDISEADAVAEGATDRDLCHGFMARDTGWSMDWSRIGTMGALKSPLKDTDISLGSPKWAFASYWNDLHGPGSWDVNSWVAAITFERETRA